MTLMQFQIGMQNFFIKVGIKTVFSLVSALSALLCHVLCSYMIPVNKNGKKPDAFIAFLSLWCKLKVTIVREQRHYVARTNAL